MNTRTVLGRPASPWAGVGLSGTGHRQLSDVIEASEIAAVVIDAVTVRTPEQQELIRRIQWRVLPGQRWVVLGPNGAGKTTLLSVVGAERHPSDGQATVLGETFGRTDMRELRSRIGRVDPAMRMLDWLTPQETVLTGLQNTIWPRWLEWSSEHYARAQELLDLVGCGHLGEREMRTLSHGERQRIRIARALIARPNLMLLDEPATGLDFPAREALLAALDSLASSRPDLPTIMVSHHLEELPTTVTHALLLKDGAVLAQGPVREIVTSELISECFGFPIAIDSHDGRWTARAQAGWTVGGPDH
ncbi:MAG: ATP-binding cassette domain-containing protein [Chloroflexia bacterium]|nr:ATP-binding cassette domain-containing protein [Chloroflexia bacterium]